MMDDRAIQHAIVSPVLKVPRVGIARCCLFIDINAESRLVIGIDVAFPDLRRAGEYLAGLLVKESFFLDPEVWSDKVQVQIVTVADWIDIVWPVPRRAYIEEFAAVRHLAAHV